MNAEARGLGRREFLRDVSAGAAALTLPIATVGADNAESAVKRPNILFILVDQLRMDCLGAYGNPDVKTPNIDRLAADGVRFNHSVCPYPACTPSRYSLLCGLPVHAHRGWTNHSTLSAGIETFPGILRRSGYRTKAVGKMHMTPTYLDVGFEDLVLSEQDGPGRWDDDYHRYLMARGLVDQNDLEDQRREYRDKARATYWETFGALVSNLEEQHHSTTWIGNESVETLKGWNAEGGSLLFASFIKPHHPFDPPAPWSELYDPDALRLLPGWTEKCFEHDLNYNRGYFPNDTLTEPALRRVMAYYYASISHIDHQVGRMLDYLQQAGLYEDTLIVFTSDHGEYMGQHHLLLKANLMYDSLLKVPLILKWPGNVGAGSASDRLVNNLDLAPTLCHAASCTPASGMRGGNLADEREGPELVFAEANFGKQVTARSRNRKLILVEDKERRLTMRLYFDLERDPAELHNLYDDPAHQAEARGIEKKLLEWGAEGSRELFLNQEEKQVERPNVPPLDLSHRDKVIAYYRRKMEEAAG
ncbi:MAG: sulfatase-like hydrolase/transferase [Candidatus Omnitrophica bacterium]|nr:sulfatase-like hydrolase/transferase [Candidatus Omnitrophota bacterium]